MGAITGTLVSGTEFSGAKKLLTLTATVGSSDDTMTLTEATHGIKSLDSIVGAVITGGLDAAFTTIEASITSPTAMTIRVKSFEQDGTVATDFTGTTVAIGIIGNV